jgi:uncharacterized membrane protein
MLLVLYLLLSFLVVFIVSRPEMAIDDRVLVLLITSISLSLLLSSTLISSNLPGYDIHQEFNLYENVLKAGFWDPAQDLLYASSLSITIFPSVVSIVTASSGIWLFKLLYPLLFSSVPAVLYKVYRRILQPKAAFLAVFLFMSYPAFNYTMIQLARQEIAELLLVVLLWILLSPRVSQTKCGILVLILLTIGLVAAHYSLAYVYLALLLFSFFVSHMSRRDTWASINLTMLSLSVVIALAWYSFVAKSTPLSSLTDFLSFVGNGFVKDFLDPNSRNTVVLEAVGLAPLQGLLGQADRVTEWLVQVFLGVGFVLLALKQRKSVAEKRLFPFMAAAFVFLFAAVVFPFFQAGFTLGRIYHTALLFVAPCYVLGAAKLDSVLSTLVSFAKAHLHHISSVLARFTCKDISAAAILVLYFLFTSGWLYAVSMDKPTSLIIDSERIATSPVPSLAARYYDYYVVDQDIDAALWLRSNAASNSLICSDHTSRYNVLNSYGGFPRTDPTFQYGCPFSSAYVYLSTFNNRFGNLTVVPTAGSNQELVPISEISPSLKSENIIYANGGAVVYE